MDRPGDPLRGFQARQCGTRANDAWKRWIAGFCYGTDIVAANEQVGAYVARILKGDKAGDLPIVQGARFETVVNLKTAKALGLQIPPQVLAAADEVIE